MKNENAARAAESEPILSVIDTRYNAELIAYIAPLWIKDTDVVADVTYGKGNWWTKFKPQDLITHDLAIDGVDCRRLPEKAGSVDVVALDLPYISPGSRDKTTIKTFYTSYGLFESARTPKGLRVLFFQALAETWRVLAPGGRVLLKCQDFVSNGQFQPMRHWIVSDALNLGFDLADEFLHLRGQGPGNRQRTGQVHSRRAYSFLLVLQKPLKAGKW